MTENELKINGKSFSETISQIEEFMESDDVHGELFTVLRSARDFMENLNEEIQQYRAFGTVEEMQQKDEVIATQTDIINGVYKDYEKYLKIGTIDEFKALKEKKSEWKYSRKENIATCKNCSYEHYLGTYHQYATNYCPKCGSKMTET